MEITQTDAQFLLGLFGCFSLFVGWCCSEDNNRRMMKIFLWLGIILLAPAFLHLYILAILG